MGNLIGQKIGRLTILDEYQKYVNNRNRRYLLCKCDCGNIVEVRKDCIGVGSRKTNSCGCQKKEKAAINVTKNHKHKQSGTRLYYIWQGMKTRCYNKNSNCYERYGGRGIKVCNEWLNDFQAFYDWAMENGYKNGLTIDRINNDGDYEPKNCRWTGSIEQCRNRRSNITVNYQGRNVTLIELSEILGIPYTTIWSRYNRGDRGEDLIRPYMTHSSTRRYRGKSTDCDKAVDHRRA